MTEPASSTQYTGATKLTSRQTDDTTEGQVLCTKKRYRTPAQDDIVKQIEEKLALIIKLTDVRDWDLTTKKILAELTAAKKELKSRKQKQQYVINNAVRQRKRKMEEKEIRLRLAAEIEENAKKPKTFTRDQCGQPAAGDTYPDLHEAIVALTSSGARADRSQRTELFNACHTLDNLRAALLKEWYILSQQALYLRLMPRRSDSLEGKQHVGAVPVKI